MRRSGVLLHISSLPSPYGIGTLGKDAFDFLRFLKEAGQTYWEVLPINPTGYGDSPYSSFSAFATNPYFIDLDRLVEDGLLNYDDINKNINYYIDDKVNYGKVYETRFTVLRIAYSRFNKTNEFYNYINENPWLDGYASFMTLKNEYGGKPWYEWDFAFKNYHSDEVKNFISSHKDEYYFWCFTQFMFEKQFLDLRRYAKELGIELIGDLPIYVSYDSSDVWCNPEYFDLDDAYVPRKISGVPPDAFSETGQLWGNPIYNFDRMKIDGYSWWIKRFKQTYKFFDYVRIDHFRGFDAYWAVPFGSPTAKDGKWYDGPGYSLFEAVNASIPNAKIIAEDLGVITDSVRKLLDDCGYPGMRILEFAFFPYEDNPFTPHNLDRHAVVYPGTHDNATIREWFDSIDDATKKYTYEYLNIHDRSEEVYRFIAAALASPCEFAIVSFADYLELGASARMNRPNTQEGNWTFRISRDNLNENLKYKMYKLSKIYCRCK